MVKLSSRSIRKAFLAALVTAAMTQTIACAGRPAKSKSSDESSGAQNNESSHLMSIPASKNAVASKKLWTRKSPGLLTDLNISRDGSTILVATVPDRDSVEIGANRSRNYAAIYSGEGKLLAQIEMPAQIKSQTLSADGSLAIIATYDDTIRGYDRTGKQVWQHEGICKPYALTSVHKILCFHDDDSEPELAFEVLDWQGNKIDSYPVKLDSLMVKVSENEKYFVVGLNHGKVILFNSEFKPVWTKSVDGELTDIAVSSSNKVGDKAGPLVAALYNVKKPGKKHKSPQLSLEQKIAVFSSKKDFTPVLIHSRLDQVEISPSGKSVFGYGNDADGQIIDGIAVGSGEMLWKRSDPKPAEYSSQLLSAEKWLWVGFEDMSATSRHSHVLGLDSSGELMSNILVPSEEGSYLYAYAFADKAQVIAVGSDDGQLSLFDVKD
jgi:WD40 repeat protein